MPQTPDSSLPIRLGGQTPRKPVRFDLVPSAAALADLAAGLGLSGLRKLRFKGELRPVGRSDWLLEADLGATVVQPCVVTLAPVTTRIGERVTRRYVAGLEPPAGDEVEMPEDDTVEPLPEIVDPGTVMAEALALALPLYPRAASLPEVAVSAAPPGAAPLDEVALRPFAGLADLLGGTPPKPRDEG